MTYRKPYRTPPDDSPPGDPDELGRLIDLMPASGRMTCKLISRPEQREVIDAPFPVPWNQNRLIAINFNLWNQLPRPQRDLLFLRTVSWVTGIRWLKFDLYQGGVAVGLLGTLVELFQGDAMGVVAAGGLTALAGTQIWRKTRSAQTELEADEAAIRIAQRRNYTEIDAARHLHATIETVARLEGRPSLSFTELLRSQNLRAIAGLSPLGVPQSVRNQEG
ncbi:MAG TPA: DUF3318 domain-containing protein [Elainellaceae cyanobacterium]